MMAIIPAANFPPLYGKPSPGRYTWRGSWEEREGTRGVRAEDVSYQCHLRSGGKERKREGDSRHNKHNWRGEKGKERSEEPPLSQAPHLGSAQRLISEEGVENCRLTPSTIWRGKGRDDESSQELLKRGKEKLSIVMCLFSRQVSVAQGGAFLLSPRGPAVPSLPGALSRLPLARVPCHAGPLGQCRGAPEAPSPHGGLAVAQQAPAAAAAATASGRFPCGDPGEEGQRRPLLLFVPISVLLGV